MGSPAPASNPTSVLLADNDGVSGLATVRALRAAGYVPWLAVNRPGTYAARSRATVGTVPVPDPGLDTEGFVRELAAAAVRLSVAVVLPSTEIHLLTLSGREADFGKVTVGIPSPERVEGATDKSLLPKLAAAAGLQTPPTAKVIRGDRDTLGTFGFPAIVKPVRARIWNPDGTISVYDVRYVSSADEAEEVLETLPGREGLIQPFISGTLTSVSGVSWEGELVCMLHQVSPRIWPVPVGVSSYAETIPPNLELEQSIGRMLQATGWSGLFQVQFIHDRYGEHYMLDLNPRIYGSLALAVAAGLNLPAIWVDMLLGRRPRVDGYRVGVRFRHEEKDVCALARMLVNGRVRGALRGLLPRRGTTHAVFSLHDPMPLLASAVKLGG